MTSSGYFSRFLQWLQQRYAAIKARFAETKASAEKRETEAISVLKGWTERTGSLAETERKDVMDALESLEQKAKEASRGLEAKARSGLTRLTKKGSGSTSTDG